MMRNRKREGRKERPMIDLILENEQNKEPLTDDIKNAVRAVCETVLAEEECIDHATDVLSFPMLEFDSDGSADGGYEMDGDFVMLGDIVISMERAREQAAEYGHSLLRETAFLTAHSMLHLLGYDHVDNKEDEEIMCEKQEKVLNLLRITRDIGEKYEKK